MRCGIGSPRWGWNREELPHFELGQALRLAATRSATPPWDRLWKPAAPAETPPVRPPQSGFRPSPAQVAGSVDETPYNRLETSRARSIAPTNPIAIPAPTRPSANAPQDLAGRRPQRHAYADFARPLCHREGQHSVKPDRRNQGRQHAEAAQQRRGEPFLPQPRIPIGFQRLRLPGRHVLV